MPKTWREKHDGHKHPPQVERLDKPYAGLPRSATIVIATPKDITAYMRKIPRGKSRDMDQLRATLAKKYGADGACPLTTGIFSRIAAEFAFEQLEMGAKPSDVAPFWRLIEPNSALAKKLSCGPDFISARREEEGIAPQGQPAASKRPSAKHRK